MAVGTLEQAEDAFEQIADEQTIHEYIQSGDNRNQAAEALIFQYFKAGKYQDSLEAAQRLLEVSLAENNDFGVVTTILQIASIHQFLGQYSQALKFNLQALEYTESRPESSIYSIYQSSILTSLAYTYYLLNDYKKAIELAERSFDTAIDLGINEYQNELALVILGYTHNAIGQYDKSIEIYQKALSIATSYNSNNFEQNLPYIHGALGISYYNLKDYKRSGESYHQALKSLTSKSPWEEGLLLGKIGELLVATGQTELAIVFYKKSVNVREVIRNNVRELEPESQISFTQTVADDYRTLATLLLEEDRVLEAQQVLDLLKVQELEDYLRGVRGNDATAAGLDYWPAEQQILNIYDRNLTNNQTFETFLNSSELVTLSEQLRRNAQGQNLNPATLNSLQDNLKQLDSAALLYPLILDDRLELILVTPNGLSRKTVAIDRIELNRLITQFRSEILDHSSNPESSAQQLYEWLIRPIESDLQQTQTLLYAADGQLRYIPLSALHDGEQWLAQKFTINHITAASLTDFSETGQTRLDVLAGAFTEGSYSYQVGDRNFHFSGLPFAGIEVENISKEIPTTTTYFNQQFSPDAVLPQMNDNSIIHFATHATFVTGAPDDSFIVFGNGERVTLREIGSWELPNVDLVVLSACETAVSGALGNGEEILGFGYQIQRTGARAAIASLWPVSDNGTQILMNAFYTALKNGYSEADALRRAQTALATNDFTVVEGERASLTVELKESLLAQTNGQPSHPYYWASFILIGNGL